MFIKKSLIPILIALFSGIFAFSVLAQEATSTPESVPETISTSTPETVPTPAEEPIASTTSPVVPEPTPLPPPPAEPPPVVSAVEPPPVVSAVEPPSSLPPPPPSPIIPPPPPPPPPPAIDPATAPSKVTIRVLMPDGTPPPFPVFVTFVGVGNKNFGGKINANGELKVIMPAGRYYTNLLVISTKYIQGEDGPSFFLEANEERDFGAIRLIPKSQATSQSLEDKTLEGNILSEAGSATGIGKILVLIIKLLMQILEEIRAIAQK